MTVCKTLSYFLTVFLYSLLRIYFIEQAETLILKLLLSIR